jgi:NADPH:quinone reductase-like Zn-dependent oxidoreductase
MTTTADAFRAFRIHDDDQGYRAGIEPMRADELSPGEVLVRAAYSSINYKDALAGTGRGKILRRFPAQRRHRRRRARGGVERSRLSAKATRCCAPAAACRRPRDGGYAEYVRLEAATTIALPPGLSLRESMILGTAGFTAALSLFRMEQNAQKPQWARSPSPVPPVAWACSRSTSWRAPATRWMPSPARRSTPISCAAWARAR